MTKRILSSVLLTVLLGTFSILVPAHAAESIMPQKINMPSGDMAPRKPSKPLEMLSSAEADSLNEKMAQYEPSGKSLLINNADSFFYYENIDPIAKEIYDVMLEMAKDPVSEGNIGLMMTDLDPSGDEYYYEFNLAYRALGFDHPELYWLYAMEETEITFSSEVININGFYMVYFYFEEPYENFEADMTAFNQAASMFLADIDTGISEYQTVKQIHDKLINLVSYNKPVAQGITPAQKGMDLAHTAYGALVADSAGNKNSPVCDGYSLAFEYLLQQCGIKAAFMGGLAGNTLDDAGMHAWNIVSINDKWYEIDSTWDDDSEGWLELLEPYRGTDTYDYYMEALGDPGFVEKLDHHLFMVSTEKIRYYRPGNNYTYVTRDMTTEISFVEDSVHVRLGEFKDFIEGDPDIELFSLVPIALYNY